jgi:chitodextrinase
MDAATVSASTISLKNKGSNVNILGAGFPNSRTELVITTDAPLDADELEIRFNPMPRGQNGETATYWASTLAYSPANDSVDDQESPSTPTDLEVTDVRSNSITISWKASTDGESDVRGYEIFRDGASVGTTGATTYNDTGLIHETKYTYQVLAYDFNDNKSSRSDAVSGTTKEPGAPDYKFLKAQGTITLDGDLSKYRDASPVTLNAPNGDNTITFRGLWNDKGIYLAFQVKDSDLLADTAAGKPWRDDSVEWFLDARGNAGGSSDPSGTYMDEDDYHGIVNIDNARYSAQGTQDTTSTQPWNGTWDAFVVSPAGDYGYTLEIEIPWSSLGLPVPTTDVFMGFSFALNDRDPSSKSNFMWTDGNATTYENASQWKRVKISFGTSLPGDDRPKAPAGLRVTGN